MSVLRTIATTLTGLWLMTLPVAAQSGAQLEFQSNRTGDAAHNFSFQELAALPQVEFTTTTIWTDAPVTFAGVSLRSFLAAAGASDAKTISLVALNDYSVEMPVAEIDDNAPIIATTLNGETMSVRDKGPFWIVFPYDSDPKYRTESSYSRSVWQLSAIKIVE